MAGVSIVLQPAPPHVDVAIQPDAALRPWMAAMVSTRDPLRPLKVAWAQLGYHGKRLISQHAAPNTWHKRGSRSLRDLLKDLAVILLVGYRERWRGLRAAA
jgi:hypothetical protein